MSTQLYQNCHEFPFSLDGVSRVWFRNIPRELLTPCLQRYELLLAVCFVGPRIARCSLETIKKITRCREERPMEYSVEQLTVTGLINVSSPVASRCSFALIKYVANSRQDILWKTSSRFSSLLSLSLETMVETRRLPSFRFSHFVPFFSSLLFSSLPLRRLWSLLLNLPTRVEQKPRCQRLDTFF